jgi:hypothetical protein
MPLLITDSSPKTPLPTIPIRWQGSFFHSQHPECHIPPKNAHLSPIAYLSLKIPRTAAPFSVSPYDLKYFFRQIKFKKIHLYLVNQSKSHKTPKNWHGIFFEYHNSIRDKKFRE